MQGATYTVDIVLVVDATGSMRDIIERVKSRALAFHSDLDAKMKEEGKTIDQLRLRVVVFRDFYADSAEESLQASPFFTLPAQKDEFANFVGRVTAHGGGDDPETGLEGLAEAIRSPWAVGATKSRQVIVVWTDTSTHPLERNAGHKPAGYPANAPADFNELTDMWEGQEFMDANAKRLLLFTPDGYAWSDMVSAWECVIHHASKAGEGLSDVDYGTVLDIIAQSV
jgi:hypothetical protein